MVTIKVLYIVVSDKYNASVFREESGGGRFLQKICTPYTKVVAYLSRSFAKIRTSRHRAVVLSSASASFKHLTVGSRQVDLSSEYRGCYYY